MLGGAWGQGYTPPVFSMLIVNLNIEHFKLGPNDSARYCIGTGGAKFKHCLLIFILLGSCWIWGWSGHAHTSWWWACLSRQPDQGASSKAATDPSTAATTSSPCQPAHDAWSSTYHDAGKMSSMHGFGIWYRVDSLHLCRKQYICMFYSQ